MPVFVKAHRQGGHQVRGYIRARGNGAMNMRQFQSAYRPRVPQTNLDAQLHVSNSKRLQRVKLSVQGRRGFKKTMLQQKALRNRAGYRG